MPRLLDFVPCVRAVVDLFTNNVTLIFLAESVQPVELEASGEPPLEVQEVRYASPGFMLFTHWWREEGEEDQSFEQRVTIVAPDGTETLLQMPTEFTLTRPFHRVFHQQTGFIGLRMAGTYWLRLYLRRTGTTEWGRQVAERPFIVQEIPASPSPTQDAGGEGEEPTAVA
ncbi:MAG: hypothetical protein HY320_11850 [Armatimonadetes bacterium]|nr:hypothetical protein [Armatimonadota bacterium]